MHGKVWMFSNLIDDEDIEFMQHEFISYKQAIPLNQLHVLELHMLPANTMPLFKPLMMLMNLAIF